MDVYVVANQKGGVGKTTLSVHEAMHLVKLGKNGLFVDLDGQRNGTRVIESNCARKWFDAVNLFDANFTIPELEDANGLTLIGATKELNEVERETNEVALVPIEKFKTLRESGKFDFCVIDTPPALCLRLIAALAVADFVVTPFELHGFSTDGIEDLLKTIMGVKAKLNPGMTFLGMLPNKVDNRLNRHKETFREMYASFGDYMINQAIGYRDPIAEATDTSSPVWDSRKSNARVASSELTKVLDRIIQLADKSKQEAV